MKAIAIHSYGGPEVLEEVDMPAPAPAPGEVLVRVKAVAVNPADTKWRAGMFDSFAPVRFPHVLGYDIAGEVVSGNGFAAGTRVFGMLDPFRKGGYAEYAVAPAGALAAIPEGLDDQTAAAIPTAGLTGLQLVERAAGVRAGDVVLITGALGAVGRFALHFAKARGAQVIAAVRPAHREEVLALGADHAFSLGAEDWTGPAFDRVIDTVGGEAVGRLCAHLKAGGRIVTAATTPIPDAGLPASPESFAVVPNADDCARLAAEAVAGAIEVPIARVLPLAQVAQAHRLVEAGGRNGKVVLDIVQE